MHRKHLTTLEWPKVITRLVSHTSFSAGAELAHELTPVTRLEEIRERIAATSEARTLLDVKPETTLVGPTISAR